MSLLSYPCVYSRNSIQPVLGITNDFLQPSQNYYKMYRTEPRYNELRFNEGNPRYNEPNPETQT